MEDRIDLYDPNLYINRELSWLEFNQRCLDESNDETVPLLERLKFLAICYNNLDEFFMIRVPGIINGIAAGAPILDAPDIDHNTFRLLGNINTRVTRLVRDYTECWDELKSALAEEGINVLRFKELNEEQVDEIDLLYDERIHPLLTPLALDVSHPFPFISNNSLNLAIKMKNTDGQQMYARLKVPVGPFDRFVKMTSHSKELNFVMLEDIVRHNAHKLFPKFQIEGVYAFRVTRNADTKVTIDEAVDLMSAVEESVEGRGTGFPVRMVTESSMPDDMVSLFGRNLSLAPEQIHSTDSPLMLNSLWDLYDINRPDLKEKEFIPYCPPELAEGQSIFAALAKRDWILYHPYESFSVVIRFIQEAALDPHVQSIKICLYRIGKDPSIIKALKAARERGKTVSVLMEIRAKFDETNNIKLAKEMEQLGIHVIFGPVELKVHSKMLQVVRLERDHLVRYTHMSSGNYNVSTAKQYGDLSYLTSNDEIGQDVGELFNSLTGYFGPRDYKRLLVSPLTLKDTLLKLIDNEIECAERTGQGVIAMKANGLIDADVISELYRASIAGVKIELNIRGLCCLRPGIPGVSENIRVVRIVDRFLEHARIYYFHNDGDPKMYLGSSDLMPRNLIARVETLFPILDKEMLMSIRENIFKIHLSDNVKACELKSDGTYRRITKKKKERSIRSQQWLIDNRGCWH